MNGRAHRDSDVDVGVLLDRAAYPSAEERMEVRISPGSELVDVLDTNDVDLVMPPELGRAIVMRGRRVHCADAEADHALNTHNEGGVVDAGGRSAIDQDLRGSHRPASEPGVAVGPRSDEHL